MGNIGDTGNGTQTVEIIQISGGSGAFVMAGNKDILALRTARGLAPVDATNITLRSGGLIIDSNTLHAEKGNTMSANVSWNFGQNGEGAEALIFAGTLGNTGVVHTIAGNIAGDSGLTKSGGATLVLSGTNDWTGATQANNVLTINQSVLRLDGGSMPSDSWVHVAEGATFRINALSPTVLGLQGAGTIDNSNASDRTLTVDNSTATNYSFGGVIADGGDGAMNLVKSGSATQTLTGVNTYTGTTTVNAGTLTVGLGGSIGASPLVDLKAGATLDTTAQAFTMLGSQTFQFTLDPTGSGSAGLLDAGILNIGAGVVDFATLGALDDDTYVIANYSSLSGGVFATINNLPSGYEVDYDYNGGTQIALVIPEPGSFVLLGCGLLVLLASRRGRF